MGRPPRVEYEGAIHHVTARGNARGRIFSTPRDALVFLSTLGDVVVRHDWQCLAYCLMPNHYHLLLETPRANLSAGMHTLNASYARMFNAAHGRTGHVFERRFHSEPVTRDEHLLETIRYLANNPVRAGIACRAELWRWSSHRATAGLSPVPRWLAVARVHALFAPDSYQAFVGERL